MISHKHRRCIFVDIPKCAGTSFAAPADAAAESARQHCAPIAVRRCTSHFAARNQRQAQRLSWRL